MSQRVPGGWTVLGVRVCKGGSECCKTVLTPTFQTNYDKRAASGVAIFLSSMYLVFSVTFPLEEVSSGQCSFLTVLPGVALSLFAPWTYALI
jgi:hypothetical protein